MHPKYSSFLLVLLVSPLMLFASGGTVRKIDDASITSQVKFALFTHESTSALKAKVVTSDGVVLSTGEAATDTEKSLVAKLASDVRGVNAVSNNMKVKS